MIGGTALTGGIGTVFGAIVGALLIRVIDNGLVLSHVDANWFKFAIGALTVFAVVANSWLRADRAPDQGGGGRMTTPLISSAQPA